MREPNKHNEARASSSLNPFYKEFLLAYIFASTLPACLGRHSTESRASNRLIEASGDLYNRNRATGIEKMKLGAYPSIDPWDQDRNVTKQWEAYMHRTATTTGAWTCFGALGTLGYHLSVDRSNSTLKERLAKGLPRTPRVAATVGLCSILSESVYFPFMNCLPPEYSLLGNFISKTLLGGLVASSLGRNPRSAASAGLLFGTLMSGGAVLDVLSASHE